MALPIRVPPSALAPETLDRLMEEFITREGTDYGLEELSLEAKRGRLRRQLERGEVVLLFDPDSETTAFVQRRDLPPGLDAADAQDD